MNEVKLHVARIDQLIERLYKMNRDLVSLEGRMLRLAVDCGVKREEFTIVSASTTAPGGAVMDVPMTANGPGGWVCLRIPEPSEGNMRLVGVTRSDGKELQMGANVWVTDRTFIAFGLQPVREHRLHILDYNSTGSYMLHYGNSISIDAVAPSSAMRTTGSASRQSFDVSWEGTDNTAVAAYDIYVSVDGGPFTRWLTNTRQTSARYLGTPAHTYAFYSVAIDSSGNREAPPSSGDTSTTTSIANAAPVFAAVANQALNEGQTLDLQVSATDSDSAGPLTFSPVCWPRPVCPLGALRGRVRRRRKITRSWRRAARRRPPPSGACYARSC